MKLKLSAQILGVMALTLTSIASFTEPTYGQRAKFFCGMSRGLPATFVAKPTGDIPIITWKYGFGSRWTPHNRCKHVTRRFNHFARNRTLNYIRAGRIRGLPVLCVSAYRGGDCLKNGVLVTLKRGTNPHSVLYGLIYRSRYAGGRTIELENPISYSRGATYLDIKKLTGETTQEVNNNNECTKYIWEEC